MRSIVRSLRRERGMEELYDRWLGLEVLGVLTEISGRQISTIRVDEVSHASSQHTLEAC